MKKSVFSSLVLVGMLILSGCATTIPKQAVDPEVQLQMQRFDAAKSLSASETPDVYNASRLRPGSSVKIKHTGSTAKSYYSSRILREIKSDAADKTYIIDTTAEGTSFTFEEKSSTLAKIVSPEQDLMPLKDYQMPDGNNLAVSMASGALMINPSSGIISLSPLGIALGAVDYYRMKGLNEEVSRSVKGMRIEVKVVDFRFIADEVLKLSGKDIPCKVYQINSLTRQTTPPSKRIPSPAFIMDNVEKIWVSDDIPFGIAKRISTMQTYILPDPSCRFKSQLLNTGAEEDINEVVEFKY